MMVFVLYLESKLIYDEIVLWVIMDVKEIWDVCKIVGSFELNFFFFLC